MKKIVLLLSIFSLCVSCGPLGDGKIRLSWGVRNDTEQTLILKCPVSESLSYDDFEYQEFELPPDVAVTVGGGRITPPKGEINFDYYISQSVAALGEDVIWEILSEDGQVLKAWKYSDIGLPDQRFFEESSWEYGHQWEFITSSWWTFVILPENIAAE